MSRRGWLVGSVVLAAVATIATPVDAAVEDDPPGLVTFAAPEATVVESTGGGFDITMNGIYPLAAYSTRPRIVRAGTRVPVDFATPLMEREGTEAILARPDAPRSEDAMLVRLTDTEVTPEGEFTAHATTVKRPDEPLLRRAARGVDPQLDDAPAPLQVTLVDPDGEMADVVPRDRLTSEADYEVTSNSIFIGFNPLPQRVVYTPGDGTCVKDFVVRQTADFTDPWVTLRGFKVDSSFGCWFKPSKASYTVTFGDKTLSLEVEQEAITNDNFKVNRCAGAGLFCTGFTGFHTFTINIFPMPVPPSSTE